MLETSFYNEMSLLDKKPRILNDELPVTSLLINTKPSQSSSSYLDTERRISHIFEQIQASLETRRKSLLDELRQFQNESSTMSRHIFEFQTNLDLAQLISNYGRIMKTIANVDNSESSTSSSPLINENSFKITGRGLKQCTANEEATFSLSFRNIDNCSLSNVSLLDIFIISNESVENNSTPTTIAARKKSFDTSTKPKLKSTTAAANNKIKKCNCDCKMECVGEGLYEVKYKLDQKGIYSLNVLVNKKHIHGSPFKLLCLENRSKAAKKTTTNAKLPAKSQSSFSLRAPILTTAQQRASTPRKSVTINMSSSPPGTSVGMNKSKSPSSFCLYSSATYPSKSSSLSPKSVSNSKLNSPPMIMTTSSTNSNNDDSLMSSAHSILSDSLSSPLSPALSKINISNIENFNDLTDGKKEDDFLFQIGRRGRAFSEFMNPQAVCATSEHIYVTDSNNQKIEAFAHNGEFKFSLGLNSTNLNSKIRRPIGIDCKSDGKILVVDYELKCVNVYEETGKYLNRICQNRLLGPKGVCINKMYQNQIVIADSKANAVCIFDAEGKFVSKFGHLGNKNENFAGPQYVSCNSGGDIIVTDFYNHCIKVFDFAGKFKFSFGSNGSREGQFNGPTGVASDAQDNIIVVDWGNSRIQVFNKYGNFIRYINSELNPLYGPQDLAVINNTVAVADSGNHCIKLFEYL